MRRPFRIAPALLLIALFLAIGAAINFGVCWWCVRGYDAAQGAAQTKYAARGNSLPGGPADLVAKSEVQFPGSKWSSAVPSGWPAAPEYARQYEFGWLSRTWEFAIVGRRSGAMYLAKGRELLDTKTLETQDVGWPLRCWWGTRAGGPGVGPVPIPTIYAVEHMLAIPPKWSLWLGVQALPMGIRPWPFIANTLFYAAIPCGLWLAAGATRRWRRRRAGRCVGCGYDMAGLGDGTPCPECGKTPAARAARL